MQLSFLGATGTVTGSRYLLQAGGRRILVDCGLFQGYKQLRLRNWAQPSFDPRTLEAVVLTHAHIDHSGYLPALARRGFKGKVYCSAGTLDLCRILLPDSAHLQEEEARYANRHGFSKHKPALPLYTQEDVEQCLDRFEAVGVGRSHDLGGDFSFELHPAGHLIGASFARVRVGNITVTFTGDLGRPNDALMNPPAPLLPTDYLVTESTYGDRKHPAVDAQAELGAWLAKAFARGGVVVMPAFAVGRTQALMLTIHRLKAKRKLPDVPVFIDSPMAIDATALYEKFRREHRLDEAECRAMCQAAWCIT